LGLIDGAFINADRIEEIKRFRFKLLNLLLGELQPDGTRIGLYTYQQKPYSIQTLQAHEKTMKSATALKPLLEQAIRDFLQISDEFRDSARGSKRFTVLLIEESCEKRGRTDSILLTWAHTTLEQEHAIFKKEITSFDKMESFIIDLFNFLTDLEHSCPKACSLFNERVTKYTVVKRILTQELAKTKSTVDEKEFFADLLKRKALDTLSADMITAKTIRDLLETFIKEKHTADIPHA